MSQCVIVAGIPRSGTSLTGGILDALGFWMGDNPMEAGPHNPKGTFNCLDFETWCDNAFNDFPELPFVINETEQENLKILLLNRQSKQIPFGIKCSRLWLAHDIIKTTLSVPTKVIITNREPKRSLASWISAFKGEPELSTKLYNKAVKCLDWFKSTNPWPSITIEYDDLVEGRIEPIADFLEVPLTKAAKQVPDITLRRF